MLSRYDSEAGVVGMTATACHLKLCHFAIHLFKRKQKKDLMVVGSCKTCKSPKQPTYLVQHIELAFGSEAHGKYTSNLFCILETLLVDIN